MGAFMEKFSKKSVKAKLNFMSKFSIIAMVIMGIGAVIGAMELNMQTKELSETGWLRIILLVIWIIIPQNIV